ncbi:DNA primase, partial [Candidatus Micrarchaeota archaeon]|nr:DNA primase [Candidatus Micrarchaeota archaeon]
VFDGIITQRLVDITESKGTKILAGVKASNIFRKPETMLIATKSN